MLIVGRSDHFISLFSKIKNKVDQERVEKQIKKIIENPEIGKPMRYGCKGTREACIGLFRLFYACIQEGNKLIFLDLYHKDEQ